MRDWIAHTLLDPEYNLVAVYGGGVIGWWLRGRAERRRRKQP